MPTTVLVKGCCGEVLINEECGCDWGAVRETVAEEIRRRREAAGLSKGALAALAQTQRAVIRAIETDSPRIVPDPTLGRIRWALLIAESGPDLSGLDRSELLPLLEPYHRSDRYANGRTDR